MIRSDSFVLIQGWMVTDLGLKGLDLLIYAIIYSFSQDGEGFFTGSLSYLMEWTNSSNYGVRKSLSSLEARGLIYKEVHVVNCVRRCRYSYIPYVYKDGKVKALGRGSDPLSFSLAI